MLRPLFKRRLIFLASLFLLGMAILFFIAWWGRLPANTGKSSTYQTAVITKDHQKTVATDMPPDGPPAVFANLARKAWPMASQNWLKAIHKKRAFIPCPMAWMRLPHVCC